MHAITVLSSTKQTIPHDMKMNQSNTAVWQQFNMIQNLLNNKQKPIHGLRNSNATGANTTMVTTPNLKVR